ncbi:glycosyltransferase family 2 protein [Streptomyces sp. NPDC058737]|uniref:glycosyltransferase family 2 protein n=1 Tax=Streptomyces sp. NPDC058737 TaxID=3346617 RepID=UPI0036B4D883
MRLRTLLALLPLLLLVALRAVRLPHVFDPLALYGLAVLASTVCLFHLAYSRYDDPAVRPLRSRPWHTERFPPLTAQPRVSFRLAVHNERAHIEDCVRSVTAVNYPDLQLVVVDDASDDGTPDVLERLAEELPPTSSNKSC